MPLERFADETFFDAIGKAHSLGVSAVEGYGSQKVSIEIPKNLDYRLAPGEIRAVADRLAALGTRMPVYRGPAITQDREIGRKLFEFAKQLKVETVVLEHAPASMPLLEELANEYDINVALEGRLNTVVDALQGRGRRIGAYADIGAWMKEGVTPVDAISRLKDRVFAMRLSDRNALGAKGRPIALGSGAAGIAQLLGDVYRMQLKPSLIAVDSMGGPEVVTDLNRSLEGFEKAIQTVAARRVAELSREIPIKGSDRLTPEDRTRIAGAVPNQAAIKPEKHRKLLVFDANIGYGGQTGGHRSIPAANLAIELFAKATGAYEAVFSNELENFRPDKIRQFDAVFLNNTVGLIFVDPEIRESLARFVRDGGGLAGYHGTSHASMDWPNSVKCSAPSAAVTVNPRR